MSLSNNTNNGIVYFVDSHACINSYDIYAYEGKLIYLGERIVEEAKVKWFNHIYLSAMEWGLIKRLLRVKSIMLRELTTSQNMTMDKLVDAGLVVYDPKIESFTMRSNANGVSSNKNK